MSAQPAKRRKTSPLKATPVFNRDVEPVSTPRASYMAPTRASISRFNPSLLPQPRSASAGPAIQNVSTPREVATATQAMTPDQLLARGQEAFNYIMGNFNAQMQQTLAAISGHARSPLAMNHPEMASPNAFPANDGVPVVPTGEETDEQMEAMRAAIQARKQQESAKAVGTARPTPTNIRRRPGSTPPQASNQDEHDELSMEITWNEPGYSRPRSTRSSVEPRSVNTAVSQRGSTRPAADDEMEELSPDAPRPNSRNQRLATEDGLPDMTEAIRRQMEAEDHPPRGVLFSSPSKRQRTQTTPKKSQHAAIRKVRPIAPQKQHGAAPQTASESATGTAQAPQADPRQLDKQEEKARLVAELRKLREEVHEFEHYARMYTSEKVDAPDDLKPVINLLNASHNAGKRQVTEPALSSLLTSFLPFSVPVANPPTPPKSPGQLERFVSHEPLMEKDPLPLNSLFTPLRIESSTEVPVAITDLNRLSQKHSITLSSPGSLLMCSINLTVSSESSTESVPIIENLEIKDLSPWAKAEIGEWLNERCKECDLVAVGYSLGRYWDISVKRAQCWMQCQKEFPRLLSYTAPDSQVEGNEKEVSDVGIATLDSSASKQTVLSKQQLLPHLGRSILVLQKEDAVLRVSWRLQFVWTGDVESVVDGEAALPQSWYEADTDRALRKIPATFDALVREGGVTQAVRVVAGLLFDTQR